VTDRLEPDLRDWIEQRDMFFLATVDDDGWPTCSYKGGDPGFVRALDERTLAWPNYDGNGMYLSTGNIALNGRAGLLFVDFAAPRRARVEGSARLTDDAAIAGLWEGAQFACVLDVRRVYPNCPRYVHRMEPAERSRFVPRRDETPPVPAWKRADWAADVLPHDDPAAG
jgi:predicted pyridoxine 5'-phosphate oxidase superfamily flavin-nucleotide-binding protein